MRSNNSLGFKFQGKSTHSMKVKIKKRRIVNVLNLLSFPIVSQTFSYSSLRFYNRRQRGVVNNNVKQLEMLKPYEFGNFELKREEVLGNPLGI
ncbi:hypothetical protein L6452_21872 [Arctium lappa]|uniref:Uncharacterized protein n=1 Tax=Arctium lappa TaxID=4217 RepID=A0ACB9B2K0_ARCLA|nr:hypothetical protein L6452_21872 [Arctium lappa]